ncbi:MAG: sigma-70 family RNA polymerase sigma factor [Saprospiraceae bacterium]
MSQHNLDFHRIFKEFYNPLVNFIFSYLKDWEDSEEVVQNVFTKLWENKDSLNLHGSLKGFLYQSAKNAMIDYIRANKRHSGKVELNQEVQQNLLDRSEELLDSYIIRAEIQKLMLQMKPKNREIFELNKFEGLTYEEISKYMNISKRSVEDNISRSMAFIKENLKNNRNIFE